MKILIVKLSSLGDVVHAMPAVQDIVHAIPHAQIDWVVEGAFAPLVERCAGVQRVIPCELRRWRNSPLTSRTRKEWIAFKKELQSQSYDAVIDLQGLTKSALVVRLTKLNEEGKRYALANQTDGSSYEAPTRWVAHQAITVPQHIHAVMRSRQLCALALGYVVPLQEKFGLIAHADNPAVRAFASSEGLPMQKTVVFAQGTSRLDKQWPAENWIDLARRLHNNGLHVALLHGTPEEAQRCEEMALSMPQSRVWPRMSLDVLTDILAKCAGVIGVDSGISHMAVALDLPHVQIYNFDSAWRTGPESSAESAALSGEARIQHPRQRSVFAQPQPSVDAVWDAWKTVNQENQLKK